MDKRLTFHYDREADILYINMVPHYPAQESEEMGDEIIARFNPETGQIEGLEVLFFTARLLRGGMMLLSSDRGPADRGVAGNEG